ncbi:hypothetical protein M1843_16200 [Isoptericola sp. 4D.3]|uniref:Uncharacterized protein n=1 Tax=Isoptericola peretonis TaxID=2918523 RepID=A0ABT0J7A2_9MICO|nr:hypothetical protein [Isoptericola sp. 4D.3]
MHAGAHEAWAVFAQALSFTARHYPVVLALGVLASAQRFLSVGGDDRFAWAGGLPGELFTAAVRLLFLAWVVRALFAGSDLPWSQVGPRLTRFVDGHTAMLVASGALLVLLTVVAKVIPDAIAGAIDDGSRATFLAWELAIKNVTVIPFVMVWMTTVARVALLGGAGSLTLATAAGRQM